MRYFKEITLKYNFVPIALIYIIRNEIATMLLNK